MSFIRKRSADWLQVFALIVCMACVLVCLYPMYYVFIMSISDPSESAKGVYLIPRKLFFESYKAVFANSDVWNGLKMSFIYVCACTILMLMTCSTAAYPLTRKNLCFRKVVILYMLIPMYIGGGMIPSYLNMVKLGLYDTVWAIILPSGFGIWNIVLVRTYYMSIPADISEAAFIDGAGHFRTLAQIYVPLSKPVLAVIAIYTIVGVWNSWFSAMIYLPNYELHPIQMYLQRVLIEQSVDLSQTMGMQGDEIEGMMLKAQTARQLKYAIIMIISTPIIVVYPIFQKHFVKGVMLGSLKG